MKKFLSLALALTMAASMFTVGASAKEFNDGSSISYKEAVDVVSAAGIVDGYEDGTFNPEATLTRGAAAKIICNLVLGPTTASALNADTAPYSDVPTSNTFAGYIAYCKNEGIISGYADGTFRPANTLTGYAFMKMLLGALGYDSSIEGYTGANWSVNVAKRAIGIELNDGNDDFVGTKAVTRQEACLYAFNTLKATMVEYSDNTTVSVGDITITNKSKATEVKRSGTDYTGYAESSDEEDSCGTQQFVEKYFDKLKGIRQNKNDDFGAPATKWTYDGNTVGTYADDADKTLTVKDAEKTLEKLMTGGDYLNYATGDVLANATVYFNGLKVGTYSSVKTKDDLAGKGDIIDVYENDDNDAKTIVIRSYTYAKIDDVDTELSSTLKNRGASVELSLVDIDGDDLALGDYYDDHTEGKRVLNGYEADTYKKGAVLAVALSAKTSDSEDGPADPDEIIDSYVVEAITGKPSAARQVGEYTYAHPLSDYYGKNAVKSGNITINGNRYNYAAQFTGVNTGSDLNFSKEYAVYLTKEGYVLAVDGDAAATLSDVYFVLGAYTDINGGSSATYVQALSLEDSTIQELKVNTTDASALKTATTGATSTINTAAMGLYKLDKNSSGKYTGKTYTDTNSKNDDYNYYSGSYHVEQGNLQGDVDGTSTKVKVNGASYYITDNTRFVSLDDIGANLDVDTATGRMSMKADCTASGNPYGGANTQVAVISHNGDAVFVIYYGLDLKGATSKADIVYMDDNANVKTDSGYEGTLWFMEDNTSKDVTVDKDGNKNQGFHRYNLKSNGVYDLDSVNNSDQLNYYLGSTFSTTTNTYNPALYAYDVKDDTGVAEGVIFGDAKGNSISTVNNKGYKLDDGSIYYTNIDFTGVSMKNATVIDTRGSSAKNNDKYGSEINSVSKLVSALNKGYVQADVYVEDGTITFIAVTQCENED